MKPRSRRARDWRSVGLAGDGAEHRARRARQHRAGDAAQDAADLRLRVLALRQLLDGAAGLDADAHHAARQLEHAVFVCGANESCDAERKRCIASGCENPDKDGDGEKSRQCGGNDCDDDDRQRHPSAAEVCDAAGKDEDCDLETFGKRDQDGDGFVDAACWNDRTQ
jgi:hypothetical protein